MSTSSIKNQLRVSCANLAVFKILSRDLQTIEAGLVQKTTTSHTEINKLLHKQNKTTSCSSHGDFSMTVLWNAIQRSLVDGYRRFGGTC